VRPVVHGERTRDRAERQHGGLTTLRTINAPESSAPNTICRCFDRPRDARGLETLACTFSAQLPVND
jgi:hypothetical protein